MTINSVGSRVRYYKVLDNVIQISNCEKITNFKFMWIEGLSVLYE
jgi:hypothetical protein